MKERRGRGDFDIGVEVPIDISELLGDDVGFGLHDEIEEGREGRLCVYVIHQPRQPHPLYR